MKATAVAVEDIAEAGMAKVNIGVIVTDRGLDSSYLLPGFCRQVSATLTGTTTRRR
jgi:hypothetical protein